MTKMQDLSVLPRRGMAVEFHDLDVTCRVMPWHDQVAISDFTVSTEALAKVEVNQQVELVQN